MNKIKTFLKTLFFSFTDPGYYRDVIRAKFSFSIKYFLTFYLFLSLLFSIYSWNLVKHEIAPKIDGFVDQAIDMYPVDLVVSYDGESNILSTSGVEEPIIIPMFQNDYLETDIENLLVIDTDAAAEDISTYKSAVLLTDSHAATISDRSGGYQVFPFAEMSGALTENETGRKITQISLDKSFLDTSSPSVKMGLHKIARMIPVIVFFGSLMGLIVSRLVILLIFSVFNLILALILGKNLAYAKIYQLGLHTITVADGITKLSSLVFRNGTTSLFSWAFLGISFIALLGVNKKREK